MRYLSPAESPVGEGARLPACSNQGHGAKGGMTTETLPGTLVFAPGNDDLVNLVVLDHDSAVIARSTSGPGAPFATSQGASAKRSSDRPPPGTAGTTPSIASLTARAPVSTL